MKRVWKWIVNLFKKSSKKPKSRHIPIKPIADLKPGEKPVYRPMNRRERRAENRKCPWQIKKLMKCIDPKGGKGYYKKAPVIHLTHQA